MDLSARFAMIVTAVLRLLAHRAAPDRALAPIILVLHGRLRRMAARLDRLIARYRAGQLEPRKAAAPKPARPQMYGPPAPRKPDIIPRRHGWIVKFGWQECAYKGYLEQLLAEPEMKEFLQAAPQAWRILRPLCRMLAVEHGVNGVPIPPPLKPRRPRPPKATRNPSPAPLQPFRPLARRYRIPRRARCQ